MAKRKQKNRPQERTETLKEQRLKARQRERDRRFLLLGGGAAGLALVFVLAGLIYNFIYVPNTTVLAVDDVRITTDDFRKRYRHERTRMTERLAFYQLLQRQFGLQQSQAEILRLQNYLRDAFSMGVYVKTQMIEDVLIAQAAQEAGIAVDEEEVDDLIEREVAERYEKYTAPEATATITARREFEAMQAARQEEQADPDAAAETAPDPTPTPEPIEVLTDSDLAQGLEGLDTELRQSTGLTLEEYRDILRADLLRTLMTEHIGTDVTVTEPQVRARHILLAFSESEADQAEQVADVAIGSLGPERTETESLALAWHILDRLAQGESFEYLVSLYSDDPSKENNQGDLGWFGPGRMVSEFEEAAFALAPNEYSEPVRSDFGYHIIEVLNTDPEASRDPAAIQQDTREAFAQWLDDLRAEAQIEERGNLSSQLPAGADREAAEFTTGS